MWWLLICTIFKTLFVVNFSYFCVFVPIQSGSSPNSLKCLNRFTFMTIIFFKVTAFNSVFLMKASHLFIVTFLWLLQTLIHHATLASGLIQNKFLNNRLGACLNWKIKLLQKHPEKLVLSQIWNHQFDSIYFQKEIKIW